MRALLAAGIAAAFAGCSASDQVTTGKTDESEPVSRAQAPEGTIQPRIHSDPGALIVPADEGATVSRTPGPEIVKLRSRSGTLTVYSSEVGPLFTIETDDGVIEAEGLSYVELQDRYPSYYRAIRSSIAADGRLYAGWYDPEIHGETRALDGETGEPAVLDARRVSPAAEDVPGPLLHADW